MDGLESRLKIAGASHGVLWWAVRMLQRSDGRTFEDRWYVGRDISANLFGVGSNDAGAVFDEKLEAR